MMKTILIPTDFSEHARNAIRYAMQFFNEADCEFILFHAYQEPHATTSMLISIKDIIKKDSQDGLNKELKWIEDNFPSKAKKCRTLSKYGMFHHVLRDAVKSTKANLVVMGTKGSKGLISMFVKSRSADIVNHNAFPVLVIPENCQYLLNPKVCYATDLKELSTEYLNSLNKAIWLFKNKTNQFSIASVLIGKNRLSEKEELIKQDLLTHFHELQPTFEVTIGTDIDEALNQFILDNDMDIIVLVARKHTLFEQLVNKSITKEMVMFSTTPMLILPEKVSN